MNIFFNFSKLDHIPYLDLKSWFLHYFEPQTLLHLFWTFQKLLSCPDSKSGTGQPPVNPSEVNDHFPELAQGWQITWSHLYEITTREYTKQNLKDKHNRYVYIYRKNTIIHKYTAQRIQSIQKCLIQHAYTKVFNTQYAPKEQTTNSKQNTSSYPVQGKATCITQSEEGKGRMMSNAITRWANKPHSSNRIQMKPK